MRGEAGAGGVDRGAVRQAGDDFRRIRAIMFGVWRDDPKMTGFGG